MHRTQVSSRRCQPQLESIHPPSASQGSSSRPPHTHVPLQLLLLVCRGSCILGLLWGPGRSLFSKGLLEGQRVPYLPPLSRAGLSCCSSQLGGGLMGQARGVGALFGQAEQLLGQLLILHHLPSQTRSEIPPWSAHPCCSSCVLQAGIPSPPQIKF